VSSSLPPPPPSLARPGGGGLAASSAAVPPLLAAQAAADGRPPAESAAAAAAAKPRLTPEEQKRADEAREKERRKRKEQEARDRERRELDAKARAKRLERIPPSADGAERRLSVEAELLAPYRLCNPLPPLPVDPKLLHHARDKEALVRFRYDTPIEATHPNVLTPEPDLGIAIDLVDPSLYEAQPGASLHPDDAALLAAAGSGGGASAAQRVKSIRQEVTWLRKTPLMGNNLYEAVGYGKLAGQQIERKVAEGARRESRALAVSGDADERGRTLRQVVEAIERSFDDAEALTQPSVLMNEF